LAYGIFIAMKRVLTVDRAGRIVLPKQLREQFNLHSGSQLEIALGPDRVELKPAETAMMLRRKRKLWVHHGRAQTSLDRAVTNLREERLRAVVRASQS
jgi:AbrB family looped-hinge helix DNA binding protein